ncbi:MAG TPA: SDR family oxidoreductase [Candidatus Angelobacter sp.]|nr:SDR family oxidoreductase [Candidatus Angelobacter sp.]
MQIQGKVVIVTGGANGIGRALCHRFAKEGVQAVIVADIDLQGTTRVADEINGLAAQCDVGKEPDIQSLVAMATEKFGRVDIFCSNAGIGAAGGPEAPNREWERSWEINVMAHIYAARAVLPQMLARKEGYLLQTVSAAGLLTQIGSAPYSVTKHAALGFAEWLAVTYGDQGIRISALCPQGVKTDMLLKAQFAGGAFLLEGALEPEQVADDVVKAMAEEKFLILPHPEAAKYFQNKANDYERWIRGMRKLVRNSQPMKAQ